MVNSCTTSPGTRATRPSDGVLHLAAGEGSPVATMSAGTPTSAGRTIQDDPPAPEPADPATETGTAVGDRGDEERAAEAARGARRAGRR